MKEKIITYLEKENERAKEVIQSESNVFQHYKNKTELKQSLAKLSIYIKNHEETFIKENLEKLTDLFISRIH